MTALCLDSLFPDVGHDAFVAKYYLEEHLVQHGDPARLPPFLRAPAGPLGDFASARSLETEFDVAYGGKDAFVQQRGSGSAEMLYDLGATVRFTSLETKVPAARVWLHKLSKQLGMPARNDDSYGATINAWASRKSKGVAYHYDTQEVILIQLVGRKRFMVAENRHTRFPDIPYQYDGNVSLDLFPLFTDGFPEGTPQHGTEVELAPGSAIFMPRGTWHCSEALDGDSFAVAIVLEAPSTLDLCLSHLRKRLRRDPAWRRPIHAISSPAIRKAETARIEELLKRLESEVEAVVASDIVLHAASGRRAKIGPTSKHLFQVSPSASIEAVAGATGLKVTIRGHSPRTSVGAGAVRHIDAALEIDASFAPAIRWLSERRSAFTLDDLAAALPELAREDLSALLEPFVELHFVVINPCARTGSH